MGISGGGLPADQVGPFRIFSEHLRFQSRILQEKFKNSMAFRSFPGGLLVSRRKYSERRSTASRSMAFQSDILLTIRANEMGHLRRNFQG